MHLIHRKNNLLPYIFIVYISAFKELRMIEYSVIRTFCVIWKVGGDFRTFLSIKDKRSKPPPTYGIILLFNLLNFETKQWKIPKMIVWNVQRKTFPLQDLSFLIALFYVISNFTIDALKPHPKLLDFKDRMRQMNQLILIFLKQTKFHHCKI